MFHIKLSRFESRLKNSAVIVAFRKIKVSNYGYLRFTTLHDAVRIKPKMTAKKEPLTGFAELCKFKMDMTDKTL
ncbi:CLUMA_CG003921, isoform A [Clunio marinus]|uniref:CLUMA_CG003921, isoform A n=1 Tax=Clunio marinus TaxID=568069 RepID=A0A1J1HQ84_9DIPT|nr:CLUMA_CG003921, isoform A [Clunio marinus]